MNEIRRGVWLLAAFVLFPMNHGVQAQSPAVFEKARKKMVQESIVDAGVKDERVVRAMLATPRHEFVDPELRGKAYLDMALPIGEQQTISSPLIVAYMTQSVDPQPTDKVLEIGTGSGFQAAVLSPIVKAVYTIEIVESLGKKAERTLKRLKYHNVFVRVGDGFQGWPEHAPFDKIVVTCSPEKVPPALVGQLREGGLMVIPVGERYQQTLYLFRKREGKLESESLLPTLFVPMTGQAESRRKVQPDPLHPKATNGDFEQPADEKGFISGWYYQKQAFWETHDKAPMGPHVATFRNQERGQSAHALQGFAIDGRAIVEVELSGWIRAENIVPMARVDESPAVAITLYDDQRKELGAWWLGPFKGTFDWKHETAKIQLPPQTREGILRIGLFGSTGEVSFDGIELKSTPKEGR